MSEGARRARHEYVGAADEAGRRARLRPHAPSDAHQAARDDDRVAAHADEQAVTGDQHAADRDIAATGRDDALLRTAQAHQRDEDARRRDARALAIDRRSDQLDRAAERQDAAAATGATDHAVAAHRLTATRLREAAAADRARAADDRRRGARDRALAADDRCVAADDRSRAAEDRVRAATDRAHAASDRARALNDRDRAAADRDQADLDIQRAFVDDLTGTSTRAYGLMAVRREMDRARRSGEPLVLAFLDVDGLREHNDRLGHAGGDEALRFVGATLRSSLRSYDPIVRVGGDEFVCVLSNTTLADGSGHFAAIDAALREGALSCSVSAGIVEMLPDEQLEALMDRGDGELYRVKAERAAR